MTLETLQFAQNDCSLVLNSILTKSFFHFKLTSSLRSENSLGDVVCRATTVLRIEIISILFVLHEEFSCLKDLVAEVDVVDLNVPGIVSSPLQPLSSPLVCAVLSCPV